MIQVYAPLSGHYSFSTVAHALIDELLSAGLDLSVHDMDPAGLYTDIPEGVKRGIVRGGAAIALGPPLMAAEMMRRGEHLHRLGMMVWEADALDPRVVAALAAFQIVCVPSEWCLRALHVPVYFKTWIVPHGLDAAYRPIHGRTRPRAEERLSLLHLCSAYHAPARKGTRELIAAVGRFPPEQLRLTIRLPSMADPGPLRLRAQGMPHVTVEAALSLAPKTMTFLYQSYDALVQPSRAEGFGLPPLEARACGVPVAYTSGTGHAMHYPIDEDTGVVHIFSGGSYQHPHETGRWLDVKVDDVYAALVDLRERFETHQKDAFELSRRLFDQWSWSKQLRPVVTWAIERDSSGGPEPV